MWYVRYQKKLQEIYFFYFLIQYDKKTCLYIKKKNDRYRNNLPLIFSFMNTIDSQYLDLVKEILKAPLKENRTWIGTHAIACRSIRHDMSQWFPLLTTKKVPMKIVAVELEWFIKWISDKKWYQERNCHIWDERCNPQKVPYGHDEETKKKMMEESDLGRIYGVQRRDRNGNIQQAKENLFNQAGFCMLNLKDTGQQIDQVKRVVETLKTNPFDRRMIVNARNPSDLNQMALPPCHYSWQVIVTLNHQWEKVLNLTWNQRSVDTMLGLPFNIASYALLLMLLAKEANMIPGILMGSLGDVHIYENHIEWAKEQMNRTSKELPKLELTNWKSIWDWQYTDFELQGYDPHPTIKFDIAV